MPQKRTVRNIFLIFVAIFSLYRVGRFYLLHSITDQISTNNSAKDELQIKEGKPFSILILGTDVGELGRGTSYAGNTDTIEIMTVNPTNRRITLTAIPRDTLVKVTTKAGSEYVKINAAYPIGGAALTQKQISQLLDVPIKYYALVNMGMLEKVVDAVGGVEVDNPFSFKFDGHIYPKGKQTLNGKQALGYARMRYDDPNNDYGRQKRGQQIILGAINKFKKEGNITQAVQILHSVKNNIRTDLPLNNIQAIYQNYYNSTQSLETNYLQGKDAIIDGVSFQIATSAEINRTSKFIRKALGLPKVNVQNAETKLADQQTTWNGYNNLEFSLPNGAKYNTLITK